MKAATKKSVKMNFSALYSYVINTNYRSFSGIMGLAISGIALILLIIFWDKLSRNYRLACLFLGLIFTVINPLVLAWQTFKQLKLSPSYKKPLDYTFTDEGITVEQGELNQQIGWDNICRIMMTSKMIAIYTSRVHAFVIPLSELGDERGKIISSVVSFTTPNNPRVSKNLKSYVSGKGL